MDTTLSARKARTLLMQGQGLLDDPTRRATIASLYRLIHRMGYVQLDSINVLERAHHLTLATRLDGYRPSQLSRLLEERRSLFEHWTDDASAIPSEFFPMWKHRFEQHAKKPRIEAWLRSRLGEHPERVIKHVLGRVRAEGPLMSKDFEHKKAPSAPSTPSTGSAGSLDSSSATDGFWNWKPQKAALEHLWWSGRLAVTERRGFQKVYDLTERVLPAVCHEPAADHSAYIDWACREALDRLGVATGAELAEFWGGVTAAEGNAWCRDAVSHARARSVQVLPASPTDKPRRAIAVLDFERRLKHAPPAPNRMRLLCPFDPVIRDRRRLTQLFDFDYRFEGFVPPAKRKHGYYVLAILEGERLVGRLDPKFVRDKDTLAVRRIFWEVSPSAKRQRRLRDALEKLAAFIGASKLSLPRG